MKPWPGPHGGSGWQEGPSSTVSPGSAKFCLRSTLYIFTYVKYISLMSWTMPPWWKWRCSTQGADVTHWHNTSLHPKSCPRHVGVWVPSHPPASCNLSLWPDVNHRSREELPTLLLLQAGSTSPQPCPRSSPSQVQHWTLFPTHQDHQEYFLLTHW